jgi:hypothetical protein
METTFMNSTSRAANLKAIITDNKEIRSQISHTIAVYEHGLNRDLRGSRLANMIDPEDSHFDLESRSHWNMLCPDERQLLQDYLSWIYGNFNLAEWQASASIMDEISISGVRYAKTGVQKLNQDSYILFTLPGEGPEHIAAGEIINIFQHWHTTPDGTETRGIYLVINRFSTDIAPVMDIPDPYRRYPAALGYICRQSHLETRIIEAKHVWGHFGMTPMIYNGQNLMHVIPLSRVSFTFTNHCCLI